MRTELERTEQTVAIGSALALLVVLLAATLVVLWMLHTFTDAVDGHESSIFNWAAIASVAVSVASLARSTARR